MTEFSQTYGGEISSRPRSSQSSGMLPPNEQQRKMWEVIRPTPLLPLHTCVPPLSRNYTELKP